MENTALNGTASTEDHEDWKKKKGYGPIIVAVFLTLLFGLSFYTGGPVDGGTTLPPPLHRDEKDMQKNVAASSSSMSLVGSGSAASASDMKTITIAVDDDELIDVLLSGLPQKEKRQGGSAAHCQKNTGYNCGAVFPPGGNTCGQKGCCCNQEDGTGYKINSCDDATGYAYRGCKSCFGETACYATNNIEVGYSSCHGFWSCIHASDSTIYDESCHSKNACQHVQNSTIHDGSCQGDYTCADVKNSIIGKGSCTGGGNGNGYSSCIGSENITIGNNSCNKDPKNDSAFNVCEECAHNVPDNACNQGITDDMTGGYCNYCFAEPGVFPWTTSKNKKSKTNKEQAVAPPKKK